MSPAACVVGPLEWAVFFTVSLSAFQKSIQKSRTETRIEGREMEEGRRVGVAVDFSDSSRNALRWAVDNFVRKGDYLILVTVLGRAFYEGGEMQLWEATGSQRKGSDDGLPSLNPSPPISRFKLEISNLESQALNRTLRALIPLTDFSNPNIMKKYGVKPDPETLDIVNTAAAQKEIAVVLKIYWGDAREKLCEAIDNTPLSCIFIGNRGLGKLKRVIMGSVSNHVVNNGSCPVTVVKS